MSDTWWSNPIIIFIALFFLFDFVIILKIFVFKKPKLTAGDLKYFRGAWTQILAENDAKLQILEADKLLDKVLMKYGYKGSLGEKLKKSSSLFHDLDGLWAAHKCRNKIAHELNYQVSIQERRRVLQQFERAFKDLGLFKKS
jgi:hypothetical protein